MRAIVEELIAFRKEMPASDVSFLMDCLKEMEVFVQALCTVALLALYHHSPLPAGLPTGGAPTRYTGYFRPA